GFEPRICAKHKHGIEPGLSAQECAEIRKKCEDAGISLCCLASSVKYSSPDDAEYRKNIEDCKEYIRLAAALGIKLIRVFGGRLPEPKLENREKFYDRIAAGLREDGSIAYDHGVSLCLETHDDFCRVKNAAEILKRADCPGVSVNWDFTHSIVHGEIPEDVYPLIRNDITHLHARDMKYKGPGSPFPISKSEFIREGCYDNYENAFLGEGDLLVRDVMEIMMKNDFGGFFSLEWSAWPPDIGLPREAANFKKLQNAIAAGKEK
ncbi:MAG: sugar phosphate isomerase/epimerase, partial [Victivallaceae bacterium]|nr:sugar phosphate isomerase/epimerase [Victivallaceae bacterium]